jgi:hypothetical protein
MSGPDIRTIIAARVRRDEGVAVPGRPPRIPPAAAVAVFLLLAIPCAALAIVPLYSHENPHLWGFPFFYWYQIMWVLITPVLTAVAYVIIKRARGQK